jgi:hypothetical protein
MKKILLSVAVIAAMGIASDANAQLIDESNVTITMDLQPILQLKMNGPQNIDFVFDQISEYAGGITQYGATNLSVSSTVNWDLYAVGYASNTAASNNGAPSWDQQVVYGANTDPNAENNLPISLLELHQDKANTGASAAILAATGYKVDYSTPFALASVLTTPGSNNIYASPLGGSPYTHPAQTEKYIAGHFDAATDYITGGSYLVGATTGALSKFYYSIDYRIVPGLPATFPNAADNAVAPVSHALDNGLLNVGHYAQAGVYTMNVKYVLMENN